MTKITKTLVRVSPLGVIVSTILIAGCLAPAGARGENAGAAVNNINDSVAATVRAASVNAGAAVNNMNDAARAAAVAAAGKRVTPKDYARMSHYSLLAAANAGVARNNMNDAARAAFVRAAAANAGVATNNMTDAARKAIYGNR
jgi:hypothetical protein